MATSAALLTLVLLVAQPDGEVRGLMRVDDVDAFLAAHGGELPAGVPSVAVVSMARRAAPRALAATYAPRLPARGEPSMSPTRQMRLWTLQRKLERVVNEANTRPGHIDLGPLFRAATQREPARMTPARQMKLWRVERSLGRALNELNDRPGRIDLRPLFRELGHSAAAGLSGARGSDH